MCGIAGFSGNYDERTLSEMSERLSHRGPDGSGAILLGGQDGRVGLAHRRLAILDLSENGAQPMTTFCKACGHAESKESSGARIWITYNGEIYNFPELRKELEAKGHRFHSSSDTEMLVHLYAESGLEMLSRLNGIFAFALFDGRTSGRPSEIHRGDLLIARDGMGVKPLYFAETSLGFLFASELKALMPAKGISKALDLDAIQQYLAFQWTVAPQTPFAHVKKVRPGEAMVIRGKKISKQWSFYDLPVTNAKRQENEADLANELRGVLEGAVRRQLLSDVPVGAFLSGGLDSSAIVSLMKKNYPDRQFDCFSIGFSDDFRSEGAEPDLPYAALVAKHLGVKLNVLNLDSKIIGDLERTIYALDEPNGDPAAINGLLISEYARRNGMKVLMSGIGGDDLFAGYRRHRALNFMLPSRRLPGMVRHALGESSRQIAKGSFPLGINRLALVRRVAKGLSFVDKSIDQQLASYFLWNEESLRLSLFSKSARAAIESRDVLRPLLESLEHLESKGTVLDRLLYLEMRHFLADHNLNYNDKVGMHSGVEIRVPFLDSELVDFAFRLPDSLRSRGRDGKYLLRKAVAPLLPKAILERSKTGFGVPLRTWIKKDMRDMVESTLSADHLNRREIFDPAAVRKVIDLNQEGRIDGAYLIFSLVCFEIWCSQFLDK